MASSSVPKGPADYPRTADSVDGWLEKIGLQNYKNNFRDKGWTDPVQLRQFHLEDMDDIGIKVPGHRKKLTNAIAALEFPTQMQAPAAQTKYNSTSSLYIDSTISKPCIDEIIFCVSIAIHDRIHEGEERRRQADEAGEPFPIMFDASHRHPLFNQQQPEEGPSEQSIFQIIKSIYTIAEFSSECLVISLLYIERLCSTAKMALLRNNWQPILLSAMVVAQKVWDDRCLSNADFSVIAASYSLRDVNELERQFLEMLQYNVSISASLYASYYFELRTLCEKKETGHNLKPLGPGDARVMEARTAAANDAIKSDHRKWQSMSGPYNRSSTAVLS